MENNSNGKINSLAITHANNTVSNLWIVFIRSIMMFYFIIKYKLIIY